MIVKFLAHYTVYGVIKFAHHYILIIAIFLRYLIYHKDGRVLSKQSSCNAVAHTPSSNISKLMDQICVAIIASYCMYM